MLGRRRPPRIRCTISLNCCRSASTTKSIAVPTLRPFLHRAGHTDQYATVADEPRRSPLDVSADDVDDQIDRPYLFERVSAEVDELVGAVLERLLSVGRSAGADDVRARLPRELRDHRPHCTGGTVRKDGLARPESSVLEEALPRRETRDRQARSHGELDISG
jgi:hypothetical protein